MLVVAAPVHQRAWILPSWLDHLANQEGVDPKQVTLVLNYGTSTDDTLHILESEDRFARVVVLHDTDHEHQAYRAWNPNRYEVMAQLRNTMLDHVRLMQPQPDHFLSCDTDILLPPHALRTLLDKIGNYDGIAPATYMTTVGTDYVNAMNDEHNRPPGDWMGRTSEQYAVFGAVLMTPELLRVDYSCHAMGEDLGWAANVRAAGLRLALCGEVLAKHVMNEEMFQAVDARVGF